MRGALVMTELSPTVPLLALRRADVAQAIGVSVRTLDSMIADGRFGPRGVQFSKNIHAWPVDELRAWLAAGAPPRQVWPHEVKELPSRASRVETDGNRLRLRS